MTVERAILFIDGNNWYHGIKHSGVDHLRQLSYPKIAAKLVGPAREWIGTRYYIGRMNQAWSVQLAADQRSFLAAFEASDGARPSVHYGRLEIRDVVSDAADELATYLGSLKTQIDPKVFQDLQSISQRYKTSKTQVEKAVDVMLAVDLVTMAQQNKFDTAYILSADGDYTHAADYVRGVVGPDGTNKKVFAAAASSGAQLAKVVNSFIRLQKPWFADVYK